MYYTYKNGQLIDGPFEFGNAAYLECVNSEADYVVERDQNGKDLRKIGRSEGLNLYYDALRFPGR